MMDRHQFSKTDLVECGHGRLFGGGMALPVDQMLMLDRITHIDGTVEGRGAGSLVAELDINPNLWFFACHFRGDPVMPGCLGLDALWQLLGFYLAWTGGQGKGRALGVGDVRFSGQVLPDNKLVRYELDIRRVVRHKLIMGIADGNVSVDGREIYQARNLKVGLFTSTEGF